MLVTKLQHILHPEATLEVNPSSARQAQKKLRETASIISLCNLTSNAVSADKENIIQL